MGLWEARQVTLHEAGPGYGDSEGGEVSEDKGPVLNTVQPWRLSNSSHILKVIQWAWIFGQRAGHFLSEAKSVHVIKLHKYFPPAWLAKGPWYRMWKKVVNSTVAHGKEPVPWSPRYNNRFWITHQLVMQGKFLDLFEVQFSQMSDRENGIYILG